MSNSVQSLPSSPADAHVPGYEDVSRRAYEIWEKRGRPQGNEQEHWYDAERELMRTGTPSLAAEIANDPAPVKSKARLRR